MYQKYISTHHTVYANYVITHKAYNFIDINGYIPIQVGKQNSKKKLDLIGDDTGENISSLNPYFCELTGLFWAWKNGDADIIGLSHYRRYFIESNDHNEWQILSPQTVISSFNQHPNQIILSVPQGEQGISIKEKYAQAHYSSDWEKTRQIIQKLSPDYIPSFEAIENSIMISYFHMLIAHKSIINKYCEWLFPILFELNHSLDFSKRDPYQKRAIAFIAERLINVFVHKHRQILDVNYHYVYNIEKEQINI